METTRSGGPQPRPLRKSTGTAAARTRIPIPIPTRIHDRVHSDWRPEMKSGVSWQSVTAAAVCVVALLAAPAGHAQQPPTARDLSTVIETLRSPDATVRVGVACAKDVFNESATAAIP